MPTIQIIVASAHYQVLKNVAGGRTTITVNEISGETRVEELATMLGGATEKNLASARDDVLIMHPGPMNRGVEISPEVADGPYSVILDQVTNGVAVRMALLYLVSGGDMAVD